MVRKKSGETAMNWIQESSIACPGRRISLNHPVPIIGAQLDRLADSTPGIVEAQSFNWDQIAVRAASSFGTGSLFISATITRSGRNPRSVCINRSKVRINRQDANNTTVQISTWTPTSTRDCMRRLACPPSVAWSTSDGDVRLACSAGTRPNKSVDKAHDTMKNPKPDRSMLTSRLIGLREDPIMATIAGAAQEANNIPSSAAPSVRRAPSISTCSTKRRLPAPIATRSASSLLRAAPRANSRFATFAQAIRSTIATMPASVHSAFSLFRRRSDRPVAPDCSLSFACRKPSTRLLGSSEVNCAKPRLRESAKMGCMRRCACSRLAPSFTRPSIRNTVQSSRSNASERKYIVAGSQNSVMLPGSTPLNPLSTTPITWNVCFW